MESLQLLYEELTEGGVGRENRVDLGAYLSRIAHLDGRSGIRVNIHTAPMSVPVDPATRIGMIVSEVLTTCLLHAFVGRDRGAVSLDVKRRDSGDLIAVIADDGVGLPEGFDWPNGDSMGGRIVTGLIDGLEGNPGILRRHDGTTVTLTIPAERVSNA